MSFTDNERAMLELIGNGAAKAPSYHKPCRDTADILRLDLPDLDDTTIARVILALSRTVQQAAQLDQGLVHISAILALTAFELARGDLAAPEGIPT